MTAPPDTLWACEEHTEAKHRLLIGYLHAWYPIMASQTKAINVIDGFAGPGRYTGGEPGSPLLMIDAFVNHGRRTPAMHEVEVNFDFIEERRDRVDHLRSELALLSLPSNVRFEVHEGSFDVVLPRLLDAIPPEMVLAPTFAFIDPFGYTGHGLRLSSRILQFRKCEALIYVPLPHIARFVHEADVEGALDNLFGDASWRDARVATGKGAQIILHERFLSRVRRAAGHAISFEVDAARGRGWAGYTLYFGTGHLRGLERMKEAMWRVDPSSGSRFAYSVNPDQLALFDQEPDFSLLEASLRDAFGTEPFTIEQAKRHTTLETPFAPSMHLKSRTLAMAEAAGRITVGHPTKPSRRRGTYPPRTIIRFIA